MNLKLGLLLFLCPVFSACAQVKPKALSTLPDRKPLAIGQQVPDVTMPKVLNNAGKTLRVSDFRGRLLILDFWATSCASCIQAMPRLDSLQKQFADRLTILPVTAEQANAITRFQRSNRYLAGLQFRTVVEDRALHALFPHRLLPHEVWIGPEGNLLGFTEMEAVNAAMIESVLSGKGLSAAAKMDVLDYDSSKPLLTYHNGAADTAYRYRSIITGKLNGLPSIVSIRYDTLKRLTVIRATNVSLRRLYTLVYKGIRALPEEQLELGPDQGLFCYELDFPGTSAARVRQSIREDLDRFFNVRSEFTGDAFRLVPIGESKETEEPLTL